ncbi:response regulator [Deinococcus yavapaiensis]|uniref:Response regulator receiver domain-containing protein n=1 Tax=Deinococcus yavapaiensis KR-236 TaxID=694435 RepID=A0A318S3X4_9DEIO|nr:response regulator [Deinococcus yavapaiensis]PYE49475.1 response regulator receiver domain-containing protein [Deinococcus yavapaiensis KR-236]
MVPPHVLLIEDETLDIELIREGLLAVRPDLTLTVTRRGVRGLERAQREHPDLILLDLALPDLNGLNVLTALKASSWTRYIPVLVLTNHAQEDTIWRSYHEYASAVLVKPTKTADFLNLLRTTCAFWFSAAALQGRLPSGCRPA